MANTIDTYGDESTFNNIVERDITEYIDDTLTTVGVCAFASCSSLTSVNLPIVTSISFSAFAYCSSLTSVSMPALMSVGNSAFMHCSSLTRISLPVTAYIGQCAFSNCTSLESVYLLRSSKCTLGTAVFTSTPMSLSSYLGRFGSIFVPASLVNEYKSATNWVTYADRITSYTGT